MPSGVTPVEAGLIHAYQCADDAPERATIIRRYAEITHLSMGRAEDALDLWAHLLDIARKSLVRRRPADTRSKFLRTGQRKTIDEEPRARERYLNVASGKGDGTGRFAFAPTLKSP